MSTKLKKSYNLEKVYNHKFKSADIFGHFACIWQGSPQPSAFISK